MAKYTGEVTDAQWAKIEPLLPKPLVHPKGLSPPAGLVTRDERIKIDVSRLCPSRVYAYHIKQF